MELPESSFKLQDRTAILAGPTSNFNQAIAYKLTQLGTNVAILDRNIEKSQRFAEQLMDAREINERFGRAVAIQADLSKPHHVQDAVTRAAEAFGGVDIFIDGLMSTDAQPFKQSTALDDLDRMIDVNIRASLLLTHGVLRFLESRKRGRLIFLVHDLARIGFENNAVHAATRMGLLSFVKTLSRELASSGTTANCVAMGVTEDFLMSQNKDATSIQAAQQQLAKQFPFAAMTDSERIANVVAFLASPLGSGITGQTIAVSQGLSFIS